MVNYGLKIYKKTKELELSLLSRTGRFIYSTVAKAYTSGSVTLPEIANIKTVEIGIPFNQYAITSATPIVMAHSITRSGIIISWTPNGIKNYYPSSDTWILIFGVG